jgi:hypothetical protein
MRIVYKYNSAKAQNPQRGGLKIKINMATVERHAAVQKKIKLNYVKLN